MGKIAIITGISGQDGSYLAELLLKKKYKVYGICNPKKKIDFRNVKKIRKKVSFKKIDINNYSKIKGIIKRIKPTEFYHLAAQSFINYKFEDEFFKLNPNINGTHYILSAIKKFSPKTKFYFAASSELFGNIKKSPQNEETKFNPRSAYGVSKVAGFYLTKNYREAYNIFGSNGILFNHESPRRGETFVTKKIVAGLVKIKLGLQKKLFLGNLNAKRDWGHAKDYVEAMWLMLKQKKPEDFVISTGKQYSVKHFATLVLNELNIKHKWVGSGIKEKCINDKNESIIEINKKYFRPLEVDTLLGDSRKAKKKLKWKPKFNIKQLVNEMVQSELQIHE